MEILSILPVTFITVFIIMNPVLSIVPFLSYTERSSEKDRKTCATKAVTIAGIIALLFLFLGPFLLSLLHITLKDFKLAGGLILALLGIETVLGITLGNHNKNEKNHLNDVAVLIATPLLTGPGLVTTIIVLSNDNGLLITALSLLGALFASWLVLLNSIRIKKLFGNQTLHVVGKIMGLILVALGVSYIKGGF